MTPPQNPLALAMGVQGTEVVSVYFCPLGARSFGASRGTDWMAAIGGTGPYRCAIGTGASCGSAVRKPTVSTSSTAQVSLPPNTAPVSIAMRL
jgi:hypothetical protein